MKISDRIRARERRAAQVLYASGEFSLDEVGRLLHRSDGWVWKQVHPAPPRRTEPAPPAGNRDGSVA